MVARPHPDARVARGRRNDSAPKAGAMNPRPGFRFRLYIAGDTLNSSRALANLTAFCRVHLEDRHTIEVVDLFKEPRRALADGILMTPTLFILSPSPIRTIVGTLSQSQTLLEVLGLETITA
jgi:circadian clock protein KaiB